jgi:DNA-binding beta-propeller fold protein YncE
LGSASQIEAFGIAPEASVAVAAIAFAGEGTGSVLRFAKAGDAPKDVKLVGRVLGLAVAPDGGSAYAIVRLTNRKGALRSVELVRVDLVTAKATSGPTIPATARGLAFASAGATLLIASRDEIRSLKLPGLASGPLYRVVGDNVGVAPIDGSSFVILAQASRVVLADLSGPQDRDGLVLSPEVAAPVPLDRRHGAGRLFG